MTMSTAYPMYVVSAANHDGGSGSGCGRVADEMPGGDGSGAAAAATEEDDDDDDELPKLPLAAPDDEPPRRGDVTEIARLRAMATWRMIDGRWGATKRPARCPAAAARSPPETRGGQRSAPAVRWDTVSKAGAEQDAHTSERCAIRGVS
jgi:hypothetical protein